MSDEECSYHPDVRGKHAGLWEISIICWWNYHNLTEAWPEATCDQTKWSLNESNKKKQKFANKNCKVEFEKLGVKAGLFKDAWSHTENCSFNYSWSFMIINIQPQPITRQHHTRSWRLTVWQGGKWGEQCGTMHMYFYMINQKSCFVFVRTQR